MNIRQLARICHESNKALCDAAGDFTQPPWFLMTPHAQDMTISGINALLKEPDLTSEQVHEKWVQAKLDAGWSWGPEKNEEKRTHPCIVPWSELPEEQRAKDDLFKAIVNSLKGYLK